jgi:isopenicillin-N N-acyltransferase-like protein
MFGYAAGMFPIIDVAGTPGERGRQYGAAARAQVARSLANYEHLFAACGVKWQEVRRRSRAYDGIIREFDADLHAELCGIAAGAERDVEEILALNSRTELLPRVFLDPGHAALDFGECSALAIAPAASATASALLAQNWDWLGNQRDALVVLRSRGKDGTSFLTLTEGGMLAKIGCNDRGFGICLNVLRSRDDGLVPGVPVHVLLRALLDCGSVAEALERVRDLRFAASSNILCADAAGARASIELAPTGARVLRGEGAVLCHTNHFLAPEAAVHAVMPAPSSIPRLDRLHALTAGASRLAVADIQRILSDESAGFRSRSRHPDPASPPLARFETVASVVMELSTSVMHVAPDIPTRTSYQTVPLRSERAM